ncbi:MAG: glycosyltransferase family 4 protein [Kiritimatiellae bacterium]|nr:glycosyltransferase family 4 protein [Kiritimatiellia bacterium]
MTIWIANPFDNLPPEGARPQRYWLMARAFARAGHAVTLWSSDFSHARKAPRTLASGARWEGDGFRLVLVPTPPYPRNVCLRRILSHRAFARNLRKLAELEPQRPDLVIASLPPLASAAVLAAFCRVRGIAFVVDVMDAWPENFARVVPRWTLAPLRAKARRIYRSAQGISGVAAHYIELAKSYGAQCPTHLAYHGIELTPSKVAKQVRPVLPEKEGVFRLVYVGTMGKSYDLETVIDAVREMPDVELDLAGAGPKEAALGARAEGCTRIRFHGYLGDEELRALLARADAGLVPMFDDSCVGVPYKLADYAAAGVPVVNTLHGETERLLAEHGAGVTCAAGDVRAFCAAVAELRVRDAEALRAGALSLARLFDAEAVYSDYVNWAITLTARPRRPCHIA